ncbi:MAG: hypothetical protein WCT05_08095 [Lentisphaeria bacterium]
MVNNRKKNTSNIVLLVCALLFSSLEAMHSLVHKNYGQYSKLSKLQVKVKPATFSSRQNAKLQTILILCPACVERFVAVTDHIAFFDLIAESVLVYYARAVGVLAVAIIVYSSRAPPYAYGLFARES